MCLQWKEWRRPNSSNTSRTPNAQAPRAGTSMQPSQTLSQYQSLAVHMEHAWHGSPCKRGAQCGNYHVCIVSTWIFGTGESATHHRCRPCTVVSDHTLWLEVEGGIENRAHTHHKHQRWPELCRGDDKAELTLFKVAVGRYIYTYIYIYI